MPKKNHLLFDEHPLVIIPQLAKAIGLNEAILLQQVNYWVNLNEKAGKNFKEGFTWTYNTLKEWQEQFPFWSAMTIRRTIASLEKSGYLISGNYNKRGGDKTKWYRVSDTLFESMSSASVQIEQSVIVQNEQSICSKSTVELSNMNRALPETTEETNPETTFPENKKAEPSPDSVSMIFKAIHSYYNFPDNGKPDPIPSYGKEGKAIKHMFERGFNAREIMTCWMAKTEQRKSWVSMVWVNEDIAPVPERVPAKVSSTEANFLYFYSLHCQRFCKDYEREPDAAELAHIAAWIEEKTEAGWSMPEIVSGDPSEAGHA